MNAAKEKQRLPSPDGASACSICLEAVESVGKRSFARLKCGHLFHLDCIGSAFNAKGAMQCPNCRQVEGGQWLYSSGSLQQQENFSRNDYARVHFNMAYLHNERQVERFDETPRWSTRSYGHNLVAQGEDPYLNRDERQYQGVPRYQTGGAYMPSDPGFDFVHMTPASEMTHQNTHPIEVARPLHRDLHPSRVSAMYLQSSQAMIPRSYEQSYGNMLPEFDSSRMLERPVYRRWMDDDGYEERSMHGWQVSQRHSTYRMPTSDTWAPTLIHGLPDFGLHGHTSSLERSNISRIEAARYGNFARRAGSHPSYVSNGIGDFTSRSFSNGHDGLSYHFSNLETNRMGRGILQL